MGFLETHLEDWFLHSSVFNFTVKYLPNISFNSLLEYTSKRVPAFVNAFGPLSELVVSAGAGAIALGFPVITDQDVFEVPMNLLTQKDYSKFVATSLEARGIKIKVTEKNRSVYG